MPIHDWTLVEAGIFHAFHTLWVGKIQDALNEGRLPNTYYALAEQHAGKFVADVLTLQVDEPNSGTANLPAEAGVAVAEVKPRLRRELVIDTEPVNLRRSIAIRHVTGHRLVALIEIVSPSNKDRRAHVDEFVAKAVSALSKGVHLLLVDLFPPGTHDPQGLHPLIVAWLNSSLETPEVSAAEPLTFASYAAEETKTRAYWEHRAVGGAVLDMPVFLTSDRYVMVPLAETYAAAWKGMPDFWRNVLEGRGNPA